MRIYSSSMAKQLVIVLLSLTTICFGKKVSYSDEDLKALLGDLRSVGSEEQESILKSLSVPKDAIVAEESKNSYVIRIKPERNEGSALHRIKKVNGTNKDYDLIQWYATPSRVVEHHVEGGKLESSIDSFGGTTEGNHDFDARSTSPYNEDVSHNHHDDHYHVDHHHDHSGEDGNPTSYTSHHHHDDGANHDGPTSDVFYRKMKLKKVRRNCTRSKAKKIEGWPDRSDTIVHSRSNNAPEIPNYDSNSFHQSLPAFPESRFNDVPKIPTYPDVSERTYGFSGEHLHGIPRTHFFHYKNGEGVNHYHLHNHNHIYDANGKRINLDYKPTYRNLGDHFGKLKTILTTNDAGSTYPYPTISDNYRSTLSLENPGPTSESVNDGPQKKGYHYTGTHESYGRKTYKRIYPRTKTTSFSTDDGDKTIGMEMFRYGAGQYGTDEFSSHEEKGRYPNEVTLGVDKPYPNSGEIYEPVRENSPRDIPDSREYNSDTSGRGPYKSYNDEFSSSYKHEGKDTKYNHNYEEKAPYEPQEKAPYVPQDKAPYLSPNPIKETIQSDYHGGYGGPLSEGPRNPEEYPTPYNPSDNKNGPGGPASKVPENPSNSENPQPPTVDVTHSISYSQDGDIGALNYGPENLHLFQNLRPDPDPLTIPKNARIFEHHIRLHPMHYLYSAMARNPINIPSAYSNAMYPVPIPKYPVPVPKYPVPVPKYPISVQKYPVPLHKYPVPLHKLMPNPLKMPIVPAAPLHARYPSVSMDQILRAYQSRSLYHPWW